MQEESSVKPTAFPLSVNIVLTMRDFYIHA